MVPDQQPDDEPLAVAVNEQSKSDVNRKILPVTISQVLRSDWGPPQVESKQCPIIIEGKCYDLAVLVAHATSVEISAAKATYILEDGTGRLRANKEFDSLTLSSGQSTEVEEEEIFHYESLEHTYVEVMLSSKTDRRSSRRWWSIRSIHPVDGYNQVIYHILNVIHTSLSVLTQECVQLDESDEVKEVIEADTPGDEGQHNHIWPCMDDFALSASRTVPGLPSTFSPRKHRPYATLTRLERVIMKYMCHHRNEHVLIADLAQAIQASARCTEVQFSNAFQILLSEAYITSPLDDGYVVLTPRR